MKRVIGSTLSGAVLVIAAGVLGSTGAFARGQVQAPDGFPQPGAAPIVTMISTGAEPRQPLRYLFVAGRKDHLSMDMTMALALDMSGMAMPAMELPTARMGADIEVTAVSGTGDATYRLAFTDMQWVSGPNTDPTLLGALQSAGVDVKAVSGSGTVSPRGIVRDFKLDTSAVSNPQMSQVMGSMSSTMQSLSLPFPNEPVGVGAHWEIRMAAPTGGVQTFQKIDVELAAADAASCTLKTRLEQSAPPQAAALPGLPQGVQASLESLTGSGTGTSTIHLNSLVPTAEGSLKTTTVLNVAMGGDSARMTAQATVQTKVAPVK